MKNPPANFRRRRRILVLQNNNRVVQQGRAERQHHCIRHPFYLHHLMNDCNLMHPKNQIHFQIIGKKTWGRGRHHRRQCEEKMRRRGIHIVGVRCVSLLIVIVDAWTDSIIVELCICMFGFMLRFMSGYCHCDMRCIHD